MKVRVLGELLLGQPKASPELSDVGRNARQGFFGASGHSLANTRGARAK